MARLVMAALALALSFGTGCGLRYQVDRDLARALSPDGRLALFQAENELFEAFFERDALRRQLRGVREAQAVAEAELEEARTDTERAAKKKAADTAKVGQLAQAEAKAKILWLADAERLALAKLDAHEPKMRLARARYELSLAALVNDEKLEGAAEINPEDFEAQVKDLEGQVERAEVQLTPLREASARTRAGWSEAREALYAASGGGLGSPWVDDSIVWWDE